MSGKPTALIVDDEPDLRELLDMGLSRAGFECVHAWNLASANRLVNSDAQMDICFVDVQLPDGNGIDIVKSVVHSRQDTPVIIITAHATIEMAVSAMKAGAFDFLCKPVTLKALQKIAKDALHGGREPIVDAPIWPGNSMAARSLRRRTRDLSGSGRPVCLVGPRGSGRQWLAKCIHSQGSNGPFVVAHCELIDPVNALAKIFEKNGYLENARGGTLLLSDICLLPPDIQKSLHKMLLEEESGARIMASCTEHPDDDDMAVLAGKIDERVYMPTLDDLKPDIPELSKYILGHISARQKHSWNLDADALAVLQEREWPGGLEQIYNALQQATVISGGDIICSTDLPPPSQNRDDATEASGAADHGAIDADGLQRLEKQAIHQALEDSRWNRTAAARQMGLTLRQLRYKISKYGISK